MFGAAAARHLSRSVDGVALIGPAKPADYQLHDGVFASHYDEARITRRFDADALWATFAARSIDRYRQIEDESGIGFYSEAGCLFVGPAPRSEADYLHRASAVAQSMDLPVETVPSTQLKPRFPQFDFPLHVTGYHEETQAGHINPRALVAAQTLLATRGGVRHIAQMVTSVCDEGERVRVETGDGVYLAERVLVAAGAFSNFQSLLPRPLALRAAPRTVVFFELAEAETAMFSTMPSTIVFTDREEDHVYILPPVRYPDGKVYLKLGGDIEAGRFERLEDVQAWFRTSGDAAERQRLIDIALRLIPGLAGCAPSSAACVASFTPSARPYAGYTDSPRIAVLTGGNFVAAKSSDEIGRLGSLLLLEGALGENDFGHQMAPVFQ